MLFLLSPAKRLDYERAAPAPLTALTARATRPHFHARAAELIDLLRPLPAERIAALMDLSSELANLNQQRYAAWSNRVTARNSRPALLAFDGDVYGGLAARTLDEADLEWAQQHVVILSGLYGALRPLDRLQPYRLEMGTRLANPRGPDLYAYWGDTVAEHLNRRAAADASPVIVNLASQEYFKVADRLALRPRVVECVFEDWKEGRYKVISFFAKRARGLMARYAIQHRAATPQALEGFDLEGYTLAASAPDRLLFRRKIQP
jgi:cytoplasmic iron level regulating protein YaaA (DUF328/UPF0246 family)